jgi:hypothetical protein
VTGQPMAFITKQIHKAKMTTMVICSSTAGPTETKLPVGSSERHSCSAARSCQVQQRGTSLRHLLPHLLNESRVLRSLLARSKPAPPLRSRRLKSYLMPL